MFRVPTVFLFCIGACGCTISAANFSFVYDYFLLCFLL